jgi:hypothetical protein
MTTEEFLRRLGAGKVVNCTYQRGELTGLISAWAHKGQFILTWEECKAGRQYDEHAFTRDERHVFDTAEKVLAFVERSAFPVSEFTP